MKKLSKKTFITLFTLLSVFIITILFIFNYQNYIREYNNVVNNITRLNMGPMGDKKDLPDDHNKRFMDATLYTVILDNKEIIDIINHSDNNNLDIESIVNDIIDNKNGMYIGNLLINRYSYNYMNNKIIISDNLEINNRLMNSFKLSLGILLIGEVICYVISKVLTNWLIKPAEDSFNKQKDFIADASHELKTPLAVIMASAEALENDNDKKWLNNIKNESERMSNLIKNLLDLARLENSNKNFELVNLSKITENSALTLESLMYEKKIKLDYSIDENIMFNCNSDEIKELLSIILDNAIKHSEKNDKIIVNLKKVKDKINLEVINKGLPIPKEDETKIFERFYRADKSRNRSSNRYGLGLSIAKEIVIRHNGIITASSSDGYTTFKIIFKSTN